MGKGYRRWLVKNGKMGKGYRIWMVKVRQKDKGDMRTNGKGWKDG
jgi:hypothetical protein